MSDHRAASRLSVLALALILAGCGSAPSASPAGALPASPTVSAAPSVTPSAAAAPTPVRVALPTPALCVALGVYTVVPGDTLWEIGGRCGVTVEALLAANPQITDRRLIHSGDRIVVPPPSWLPGVPHVPLSGTGSAVIDGVMGEGEWDRAGRLDFVMKVPAHDGGGSVPASLYVMNDALNLYVAVSASGFYATFSATFEFDNDDDGVRFEEGDDVFLSGASWSSPESSPGPTLLFDDFRVHCPGKTAEPAQSWCRLEDTHAGGGNPAPGTTDGAAAGFSSSTSNSSFIEMSHPLDSADDAHDFSLQSGSTVGFFLDMRVISTAAGPDCGYPECVGDTSVPANALAGHALHLTVAAGDPAGE